MCSCNWSIFIPVEYSVVWKYIIYLSILTAYDYLGSFQVFDHGRAAMGILILVFW